MNGIAPPIVTPFDADGDIDTDSLRNLVEWLEARGVDFLVPCGSNSEAELMTADERARVVEIVADSATVPVVAGVGHPGYRETMQSIESAAQAGADSALVVTPFYYNHDQETLIDYYRSVADNAAIPIYLYSVPVFTDIRLEPETVGALAPHPNIAGIKDSHADLGEFARTLDRVDGEEFDVLVGSANVLGQALTLGGSGGILALTNLAPELTAHIAEVHETDPVRAQSLTADAVELNTAITAEFGIPGLKYAMRQRGAPAGRARSPFRPIDDAAKSRLDELLTAMDLV